MYPQRMITSKKAVIIGLSVMILVISGLTIWAANIISSPSENINHFKQAIATDNIELFKKSVILPEIVASGSLTDASVQEVIKNIQSGMGGLEKDINDLWLQAQEYSQNSSFIPNSLLSKDSKAIFTLIKKKKFGILNDYKVKITLPNLIVTAPDNAYITINDQRVQAVKMNASDNKYLIGPIVPGQHKVKGLLATNYGDAFVEVQTSVNIGAEANVLLKFEKREVEVHFDQKDGKLSVNDKVIAINFEKQGGGYVATLKDVPVQPLEFSYQTGESEGRKFTLQPDQNKMSFSKVLARVKVNNKYGFMDLTGNTFIDPKFDEAESFKENRSIVQVKDKSTAYGVIDPIGKYIVEPKYPYIDNYSEGFAAFKDGTKFGYLDVSGKVIIEPQYSYALKFSEGLAAVMLEGKYGFIDRTGKLVIQPKFDSIGEMSFGRGSPGFSDGLVAVKVNGKWGYSDKQGNISISPQFAEAKKFSEGLACVRNIGETLYGFIDNAGKMIIPAKYLDCNEFSDGLAFVKRTISSNEVNFEKIYNSMKSADDRRALISLVSMERSNEFYYFIDQTGEEFFGPYSSATDFKDGYAWGTLTKSVIIDKKEKKISSDKLGNLGYYFQSGFKNGYAIISNSRTYGYVNSSGAIIMEKTLQNASPFETVVFPLSK